MRRFSNPNELTAYRNANGLAQFFDMNVGDVEKLLLLYRMENGYISNTAMTLPQFTQFVLNDLANDPTFGSQLDAETIAQMSQLSTFTDKDLMTKAVGYREFASIMGIDESQAMQLFMLYEVYTGAYQPTSMTMPQLVSFIANDIADNPSLASLVDPALLERAKQLLPFTDASTITTQMGASALANAFGMPYEQVAQIFALRFGDPAAVETKTMSTYEFISFICETMLPDPQYASAFTKEMIEQLQMLYSIMRVSLSGQMLSPSDAANIFGISVQQATLLYAYHDLGTGAAEQWTCSTQDMINWMMSNQDKLGGALSSDMLAKLSSAQAIINGTVAGYAYSSTQLANVLGMDSRQFNDLYLVYDYKHGLLGGLSLSVQQFINFLCDQVLGNSSYSSMIDASQVQSLESARRLVNAVVQNSKLSSTQMYELFSGMGGLSSGGGSVGGAISMTQNNMDLIFLLFGSKTQYDGSWTMSIEQLANYLSDDVMNDPRFSSSLEDDMRRSMGDMKTQINDALTQLAGPNFSRMIITTTLPTEGSQTTSFFDQLISWSKELLRGENHLIGSSYMSYELQQTFRAESLLIMLITALAIFLVVALSFRSLVVPAILVTLVQCGVFITISIVGLQGYAINYLAMLIVECILMGATIDYGILTTNNYRESRSSMGSLEALKDACNRSIMTILTSGLIMVSVTAIVGNLFENPAIGQICRTISIGSACAILLIVFILPALLAAFDQWLFPRAKNN